MSSLRPYAVMIAIITLASVTAQTFQYSRGWTNGKRNGPNKQLDAEVREALNNLERTLTPCQLGKLKYFLEGKPMRERMFPPCDYLEEENDAQPKRPYRNEHNREPLADAFL